MGKGNHAGQLVPGCVYIFVCLLRAWLLRLFFDEVLRPTDVPTNIMGPLMVNPRLLRSALLVTMLERG